MSTNKDKHSERGGATGQGLRPRATERPRRCGRRKVEDGRACRRNAGAGTDHPGVGPCVKHDDGSWARPAFAANVEAQDAFLAAVREKPESGIRELIEPLGYVRRDVVALSESNKDFESRYVEARGYDADAIRNELRRRAMGDGGSDRLLQFVAQLRLPEARELQRMRIDGRVELQAVPVWDTSKLSLDEKRELRRLLEKARPDVDVIESGQKPAAELLPPADVDGEAVEVA